ncbi:AAA family ATPase [Streptomyces sp. NPDC059786]|uniref:AAA family ATPase n=1 Tax=Streptomyces sp. NPDC059786 TaxID=3346946 RepID=UPI003669BC18
MLYVVTGPPAAGKSTWIEARARPSDIVIDLDRITRALTGPGAPQWNHSPTASRIALRARYAAIDEALKHLDDTDVYLIHTMPSPKWLARYRRHGAEVVAVDPGRDIVMQRIQDMRAPGLQAVATRWYKQQAKAGYSRPVTRQASRAW